MPPRSSSTVAIDPVVARIVPGIFGLIGVTVIVFLWSAPFGAWDSPPVFFRVFGSLIGTVFVVVGFRGAFGSSLRKARVARAQPPAESPADDQQPKIGYDCPNCGASLGADADVSPSGDVKCTFCDRWFNIHRAG